MAGGMEAAQPLLGMVSMAEAIDVAALYRRHAPFVWRLVRRFGVGESDVDDAVHEVFLVAHRRREDLRDSSLERSWLFGIAKRVAMATLRKNKRAPDELEREVASSEETPEESLNRRRRADLARRCIEKIDERRRMVFVLSEIEQLTGPEIAAALELELNTVYSRLRKARQEFKDAVREEAS